MRDKTSKLRTKATWLLQAHGLSFTNMADDLEISLIYLLDLLDGNRGYGKVGEERLKQVNVYLNDLEEGRKYNG